MGGVAGGVGDGAAVGHHLGVDGGAVGDVLPGVPPEGAVALVTGDAGVCVTGITAIRILDLVLPRYKVMTGPRLRLFYPACARLVRAHRLVPAFTTGHIRVIHQLVL